jgi:hypothetical protein
VTAAEQVDRAARAVDLGMAYHELLDVLPDVEQVRITWRRKRGQWLASVGTVNATGTTEAEALRGVVQTLGKSKR